MEYSNDGTVSTTTLSKGKSRKNERSTKRRSDDGWEGARLAGFFHGVAFSMALIFIAINFWHTVQYEQLSHFDFNGGNKARALLRGPAAGGREGRSPGREGRRALRDEDVTFGPPIVASSNNAPARSTLLDGTKERTTTKKTRLARKLIGKAKTAAGAAAGRISNLIRPRKKKLSREERNKLKALHIGDVVKEMPTRKFGVDGKRHLSRYTKPKEGEGDKGAKDARMKLIPAVEHVPNEAYMGPRQSPESNKGNFKTSTAANGDAKVPTKQSPPAKHSSDRTNNTPKKPTKQSHDSIKEMSRTVIKTADGDAKVAHVNIDAKKMHRKLKHQSPDKNASDRGANEAPAKPKRSPESNKEKLKTSTKTGDAEEKPAANHASDHTNETPVKPKRHSEEMHLNGKGGTPTKLQSPAKQVNKMLTKKSSELAKHTSTDAKKALAKPKQSSDATKDNFKKMAKDSPKLIKDALLDSSQGNTKEIAKAPSKQTDSTYTLESALSAFDIFDDSIALMIYDPNEDKFNFVYPDNVPWESSRFRRIRTALTNSLRVMHPERFNSKAPEFAMVVASGDYPQYKYKDNECFHQQDRPCVSKDFPPVLQFGTVFKHPVVPSTIAMPMPEKVHLGCFHHFLQHKEVCKLFHPRGPGNPKGLVFGQEQWKDLIPQVIWRATDRSFLRRVLTRLRRPNFRTDVAPQIKSGANDNDQKVTATKAMRNVYQKLVPRWKAIVWTAEAERDAEKAAKRSGHDSLPWANLKFADAMYMHNIDDTEYYEEFMKHGIPAIGGHMSLDELAKYKYHLDIGGGGGTTWSGTLEKLAMPGLFFHHETRTKDYLHDMMKPWEHYVPISSDLSDLKERYEWAEAHPEKAQKIAQSATALVKSLGAKEGFEAMYSKFYEEPLCKVVSAYKPLDDNMSWREVIKSKGGSGLRSQWKCGGYKEDDCEELGGNKRGTQKLKDESKKKTPAVHVRKARLT